MQPVAPERFYELIEDTQEFGIQPPPPSISVVVVAYNTNEALIKCLESLKNQSMDGFETLLIDNGKNEAVFNELSRFSLRYYRLKQNYLPSLARNVGIAHAKGAAVCFLDDDALAAPDFVAQHLQALQQPGILGVRGKILPKTDSPYNKLALHYNLGDQVLTSYVDMENNASFWRETLVQVGGFNPTVFAGEGAELSYRIVKKFGGPERLIYWPNVVVYHDFSNSFKKYYRKMLRGAKMRIYLERCYPDFWEYVESYHPFPSVNPPRPANFGERVQLALARRAGRLINRLGTWWYRRRS